MLWKTIKADLLKHKNQTICEKSICLTFENVINFVEMFSKKLHSKNCCAIGNHEYMMLIAIQNPRNSSLLHKWLKNEGVSTLKNFVNQSKATQQRIIEYIAKMPTSVDLTVNPKKYLLVHASPLTIWTRLKPTDKMPKGKTVIFGHTPTECYQDETPLRIWYGEDKIGIDCGSGNVHNACRLACLRLDDMVEFYSD